MTSEFGLRVEKRLSLWLILRKYCEEYKRRPQAGSISWPITPCTPLLCLKGEYYLRRSNIKCVFFWVAPRRVRERWIHYPNRCAHLSKRLQLRSLTQPSANRQPLIPTSHYKRTHYLTLTIYFRWYIDYPGICDIVRLVLGIFPCGNVKTRILK